MWKRRAAYWKYTGIVPCFLLCSLSQDPGYLSDLIVKLAGRGTADTSAIAIWIWMGEESVWLTCSQVSTLVFLGRCETWIIWLDSGMRLRVAKLQGRTEWDKTCEMSHSCQHRSWFFWGVLGLDGNLGHRGLGGWKGRVWWYRSRPGFNLIWMLVRVRMRLQYNIDRFLAWK